jgi:hypothetical protein
MQYQNYTISYQLNGEGKTLFIKVINSIMFQSYETTIIKNNFKYKLEIVKNILDNCLTNKDINLKFNVFSKQLQIICLYKTEIFDFEFEIGLDEVEIKNVESLDMNKRIYELENKIKIYEEQTPIVFQRRIDNRILNSDAQGTSKYYGHYSYSFYDKAQLICRGTSTTKIEAFIDKPENNLVAKIKQRYDRIRRYILNINTFESGDNVRQIIIPPGKIIKVWNNDNLKPTIYTHGIYNGIQLGEMFWLGSCEYKDDIPDDFRLLDMTGL